MPSCFDMICSNPLAVSPRFRGSDPYPCGSLTYRISLFLLLYAKFRRLSSPYPPPPGIFAAAGGRRREGAGPRRVPGALAGAGRRRRDGAGPRRALGRAGRGLLRQAAAAVLAEPAPIGQLPAAVHATHSLLPSLSFRAGAALRTRPFLSASAAVQSWLLSSFTTSARIPAQCSTPRRPVSMEMS